MMKKVLFIDDDELICKIVEKGFSKHLVKGEYELFIARSGKEGLKIYNENDIDIVFVDVYMPDMDGLSVLKRIHEIDAQAKVIVVSADDTLSNIRLAMNNDAFDFILKPINFDDLNKTLDKTIKQLQSEQLYKDLLEQSYEKLTSTMHQVIESISMIEEMRDPYTSGHMKRVAKLAYAIGKKMNLRPQQLEGLYVAGMLHDIGKICIPSEILSKPGGLSHQEFDLIKDHAHAGYEILKKIEFPWPVADIVHQHHERIDGSGYPQGLKGEDIYIEARILSVADVMEAVSTHRPYRPALGIEHGLRVISHHKKDHFDPNVVNACLKLFLEDDYEFDDFFPDRMEPNPWKKAS
jgi:putative two-component system response regulator